MCKFLNTPLGECDPAMVRVMFSALEEYFVGRLPSDAGAEGAESVHAVIWGRLRGVFDEPGPDGSPAEAAEPAPAMSMDVVPAAAIDAAPDAPTDAVPDAPTHAASVALTDAAPAVAMDAARDAKSAAPPNEQPDAPLVSAPALPEALLTALAAALRGTSPVSPDSLCETPAPTLAGSATMAVSAAAETTPGAPVLGKPSFPRSLLPRTFAFHRGRWLLRCCRQFLRCRHGLRQFTSRTARRGPLSPPLLC